MKRTILGALIALAAAGCGQVEDDAGGYEIALVTKGMVHQFWQTVHDGAEAAAKENGAQVIWKAPPSETEVERQLSIMEDMISRRVDAIVMAACNAEALVPVVERAVEEGIPVVTIDSGVESEAPLTFVATDNLAGAKAAAEALAGLIGQEGEVGLIPFVPGAATSELRERGFKEAIAAYPDIELVSVRYSESDVAKGLEVTEDMLTSHPELDGVFAANESGAMGAAEALKRRGKDGEVKLVAFDAAEEQLEALEEGVIHALIVQNPYRMGYEGVQAAVDALEGRDVPERIDTGVTVVTRDNLADPEIQQLLNP